MFHPKTLSFCGLFLIAIDAFFLAKTELFEARVDPGAPSVSMTVPSPAPLPARMTKATEDTTIGIASWYGADWQGRKTASGARFDMRKLTAAHRSLPLNSRVRVTNLENGRSVVVRIIDRGPYVHGRAIDLSRAAAHDLGMVKEGIALVSIEIVAKPAAEAERSST